MLLLLLPLLLWLVFGGELSPRKRLSISAFCNLGHYVMSASAYKPRIPRQVR